MTRKERQEAAKARQQAAVQQHFMDCKRLFDAGKSFDEALDELSEATLKEIKKAPQRTEEIMSAWRLFFQTIRERLKTLKENQKDEQPTT
jgi:regulator of replication initiation timing